MAIANKRIIDLETEITTLSDDTYLMVDSDTNGTAKYKAKKFQEMAESAATAVEAEATARQAADTAEATARQAADDALQTAIDAKATPADITAAVTAEATARDAAIAAEATARTAAIAVETAAREADVADLKEDFEQFVPGLSDEAKDALLACFRGVAWLNWEEDGESLYNALATALNVEPPEPTPTFNYGVYMQDETINGKYIDASGNVLDGQANKSFYIPDYIPVVRESYWIGMQPTTWAESTYGTPRSEANWRVTEYDAQKAFIKQTQYSNNTAYSAVEHTFDTNAKYIRLGWYDPYSSAIKHFDIENPAIITALPMESGDISSSNGQNTTQALRIRTVGYIDAADGTLTFTGCPFADTWREFTANPDNQTSVYGARCYDTSKNFLGITPAYMSDVSNVALLSGTKYIRFIIQYANSGTFANFKSLVNHLITINGTKYFVTGV